ncbi:hypothetical protein [Candidatus Binatus sp.]|uniref:hypothetical protein n=1 Tax=Candidatus Binatus sp. TaxID=2811406 RepID=UPI002B4791CF|nr:hypothetical protein [Candidatus Binatus sp.]
MPGHLQHRHSAVTAAPDADGDTNTVSAMASRAMRHLARTLLSMGVIGAALAVSVAACNNQTGFSGSVGNTPNGPKLTSYEILGAVGTPFTATVSDTRSSWTLQGNVPLSIVICNNVLPAAVVATKTTSSTNLLSVEIITGNHVAQLQSTSAPFGSVSVQIGGVLGTIASPADPDLRIFLSGPLNEHYQALVEDIQTGFIIQSRAPTLILFDTPDGKVDATFYGSQDFGTFTANMTFCTPTMPGQPCVPQVVASEKKGPNLTIRQP